MATRISVVKNPNGKFQGWMCKHSSNSVHNSECDGHAVLCVPPLRFGGEELSG